jgi:tRNA dimethylallyltransferase
MLTNTAPSTPIICLMGPTASGKTALAVDIVRQLPCEIISVDSAMIYREMDIGTAKPSAEILHTAPHRLIDILNPSQPYSVGQFYHDALHEITTVIAHGRIPLLVGGTMMYFRVLQQGIASLPPAHPTLRATLQARALTQGWEALHAELVHLNPEAAKRIHPRDSQRISRALEIHLLTKKNTLANQTKIARSLNAYPFISIAIMPADRQQLHIKIEQRFENMLTRGWMEEMQRLYARDDLTLDLPSMRAVGYRQAWEHLSGQYSYRTMCEKTIVATRQLAKRQITWLRSWPNAMYFSDNTSNLSTKILNCLVKACPSKAI